MIIVKFTKEQEKQAENHYGFGPLPGSITKGKGNKAGALGEIIFYDYFKKNLKNFNSTFNYDIVSLEDKKLEIKTKRTKYVPESHYLCSVSDQNTKQKCDYYCFLRVDILYKEAYILGYISRKKFYEIAFFAKKGDVDPEGDGIWTFKENCWNVRVRDLKQFKNEK